MKMCNTFIATSNKKQIRKNKIIPLSKQPISPERHLRFFTRNNKKVSHKLILQLQKHNSLGEFNLTRQNEP